MKLSYYATVEDAAEPAIRRYLRSKTAGQTRGNSALIGAILFGVAFGFVFRHYEPNHVALIVIPAALVGAAINWFTFRRAVAARMRNYLRQENPGGFPAEAIYILDSNDLKCSFLGVSLTFCLIDLESTPEDKKYLELNFGIKGLCTIPLTAFSSPSEKSSFLHAVRRESLVSLTGNED